MMKSHYLSAACIIVLSCLTSQCFALKFSSITDWVNVTVPVGPAALWAANIPEIKFCRNNTSGTCDILMKIGVQQALKYAINNAKLALRNLTNNVDALLGIEVLRNLTEITHNELEVTTVNRKWEDKLDDFINKSLQFFGDKEIQKLLYNRSITLTMPDGELGLAWRRISPAELKTAKPKKRAKALKTWKLKSGRMKLPRIGFGTRGLVGKRCKEAVLHALRTGYRLIDTAQLNENEAAIGEAIRDAVNEGIIKSRNDVFIISKLSEGEDYTEAKARERMLKQLEKLNTSYFDAYMLHGPVQKDKNIAGWRAMERMQRIGKIRHLGISNFDDLQGLADIVEVAQGDPDITQNKLSIYHPGGQIGGEDRALEDAESIGMAFVGYSTISHWPYVLPPMKDPHVLAIAKLYNRTAAQVLLRWALQLNAVIIPSSANKERIEENAGVVEFALTELDMRLLNGLSVLYHSTKFHKPSYVEDIYGLFNGTDTGISVEAKAVNKFEGEASKLMREAGINELETILGGDGSIKERIEIEKEVPPGQIEKTFTFADGKIQNLDQNGKIEKTFSLEDGKFSHTVEQTETVVEEVKDKKRDEL